MNNLKRTWATDYTVVSNTLINCFDVEPMTRFLCIFLAAQADNFQFNNAILCRAMNCTEATLRKYMKEALALGLIERKRKTVNGRFGFFDYTLIDPTTLQNLPDGKKTKLEKNQAGKNVRLNKEELSNKEEKNNKVGKVGTGDLQKLIDAEPPTAELIDDLLPKSGSVKKEKSSAKKEKGLSAETQRRVDAAVQELNGQRQPAPDEVKTEPAPLTIEDATEAIMAEIETEQGKRKLKFAAGRGGVKQMPNNLLAAVARYVEHRQEQGRPVHDDPIYKLGGYLKIQAANEATQLENKTYYQNKKANAPRNNYSRQPAQPVITREQSIRVAEKILAKRAAARQGVE